MGTARIEIAFFYRFLWVVFRQSSVLGPVFGLDYYFTKKVKIPINIQTANDDFQTRKNIIQIKGF